MNVRLFDKFRGVMYGQAIGDALGFGAEFLSRKQVSTNYPDGLTHYSQIRFYSPFSKQFESGENERWHAGDWTDDTEQMLCILDSLLALGRVDVCDIAKYLHEWACTDGFAIGESVSKVVFNSDFLRDPQQTALQYWESTGRYAAANGAVMRTSVLGLWDYHDLAEVKSNAAEVCRITHADPRCVASCIAVCLVIARLMESDQNIPTLVEDVENEVVEFHPELPTCFARARESSLEVFDLDQGLNENEPVTYGYTLKTLGAAFWVLLHASDFEEGISAIIHEGGDADTNAAVAGAMLGARFGFSGIPSALVSGLRQRDTLETRLSQLVKRCG